MPWDALQPVLRLLQPLEIGIRIQNYVHELFHEKTFYDDGVFGVCSMLITRRAVLRLYQPLTIGNLSQIMCPLSAAKLQMIKKFPLLTQASLT